MKKLEIMMISWLVIISALGGILFVLSYVEDEGEKEEKYELEKQLDYLKNKIEILEKTK